MEKIHFWYKLIFNLNKKGFRKIGYFNDRFGKGKHANILGLSLNQ